MSDTFDLKRVNITRNTRNSGSSDNHRLACLNELQQCVGLSDAKRVIESICYTFLESKRRKEEGKNFAANAYNIVLSGNSGTGKTMVAHMLGDIFNSIELLSTNHVIEVSRSDLTIGGDVRRLVESTFKEALDGILFINDIGSFLPADEMKNQNEPGRIAIEILLGLLAKNPNRLVLVVSGNNDDINRFYSITHGQYKITFPYEIKFADYQPEELYGILNVFAHNSGYIIDRNAQKTLAAYFKYIYSHRDSSFTNANFVREKWNEIQVNISNKNMLSNHIDDSSDIITDDDIPDDMKGVADDTKIPADEELFKDLNALVGLNDLKEELQKVVSYAKLVINKRKKGIEMGSGFHMVFTGNPGTGKTTVARIISKIFYHLHFLTKGHTIEVDRGNLVGTYIGDSEDKTRKALNAAKGGVLFIDEAYSLVSNDKKSNDYGIKVIEILLKYMEDNRNDIIVIVAGYKDKMEDFLNSNEGLRSRFDQIIHFNDYSGSELNEIFHRLASKDGFTFDPKLEKLLPKCFEIMSKIKDKEYANGRGPRKYYDEISKEYARRNDSKGIDFDSPLTIEDLPPNSSITKALLKEIKL